ncbi:MAG: hypothetical protein KAT15_02455, partial [Bacteroidales bacterium]|nr:hypothetical protein [Bacteroidales bacterium]
MNPVRTHLLKISILALSLSLCACQSKKSGDSGISPEQNARMALADQLEESLFKYILEPWYPLIMDSLNGGYHSNFARDWTRAEDSGERAIVQQARHVWATSLVYEKYPEKKEYLEYAA